MFNSLLKLGAIIFVIWLVRLYIKAKPKHRKEWLRLFFFVGTYYRATPIKIPRAFLPAFAIFEKAKWGFTFAGVQCAIKDEKNRYVLGKREPKRQVLHNQVNCKWDLGVGGMVASDNVLDTLFEEMYEETGLTKDMIYDLTCRFVFTPYHGVNCLISYYECYVNEKYHDMLRSEDHTYTDFIWVKKEEILNTYAKEMKADAVVIMKSIN